MLIIKWKQVHFQFVSLTVWIISSRLRLDSPELLDDDEFDDFLDFESLLELELDPDELLLRDLLFYALADLSSAGTM